MNILTILENLYVNKSSKWINEIEEESEIQPFVIQRWLTMNDRLRVQTRWLDKYVFYLPPKMYLSLAWSIIPKETKMPFIKYIKKEDEKENEFYFILNLVKQQYKMSDNDFNINKERIIKAIKNDMVNWFSYYGVKKQFWKKHELDFNLIKQFGETKKVNPQKGLDCFM